MKFNSKNSKIIGIVIGIIMFAGVLVGITYAVFNWRSSNTNISANTKCFDVSGGSSYSVSGSNLLLHDESDIIDMENSTITYKNDMIYLPLSITTGNDCNTEAYYEISINITTLSSGYRDGALKFAIIRDMSDYSSGIIEDPTDEDLTYRLVGSTLTSLGTKLLYRDNLAKGETVIPAVIIYLDGDLVSENAPELDFEASINVNANQGQLYNYITKLYDSATKTQVIRNSVLYNLAPSVNLMNDRKGSMETDIDSGNIRYYGANPNNYIWLGDIYNGEYNSSNSEHRNAGDKKLWRIVGLFDGRLKLVSNDALPICVSWDTSASGVNSGDGINQWGESTYSTNGNIYEGADLMRLLNAGYEGNTVNNSLYWNKGTGTVYKSTKNATAPNIDFSKIGLSETEKSLIDDAVWYTTPLNTSYSGSIYANNMYSIERSITSPPTLSDNVIRTNTWEGKVALVSASDYAYATDLSQCFGTLFNYGSYSGCYDNIWLKDLYFLNSYTYNSSRNICLSSDKSLSVTTAYNNNYKHVYPAVFLKENVDIIGGSGTEMDPYVVDIIE